MTTSDQKLDALLQKTAKEWAAYFVPNLEKSIDKKKIGLTGALEGSFETSISETDGGLVVTVKYLAYGNVLTRSKVFWTKPANGYALEQWVRKVGVGYFSWVPGYGRGQISDGSSFGISAEKQAKRIAAALAFQRVNGSVRREYGKMKARNWKKEPVGRGKAYLGHLIRERIAALTQQEIVDALTTE